jgi:hypothetical protein
VSAPNQVTGRMYSESEIRPFILRTDIMAQELTAERQRTNTLRRDLHHATHQICKLSSDKLSADRTGVIAGHSVGVGTTSSIAIGGVGVLFVCPPVGILMLIAGLVGLAAESAFLGITCTKENKIKQVMKNHRELTYKQAMDVVDRGHVDLRDIEGRIFKYTETQRSQQR